jgi:hypothetical protein
MFNPVLFLLLLLLGLGLAAASSQIREQRASTIAAVTAILILVMLLAARVVGLPLTSPGYPWSWVIGEQYWWLSLALALVTLTALLAAGPGNLSARDSSLLFLLLTAGLAATWANSPAAQVITWSGLALLIWFLFSASGNQRQRTFPAALGLAPLTLWLAAAFFPAAAGAIEMEGWRGPARAETLWLLAAVVALGAFPFHLWRPQPGQQSGALVALGACAPAAAGAALLASLAGSATIASYALPLTLAGLLGLLGAAYLAWSRRITQALILGEANLVLLLGVWGTVEAVLAESRVLLFAGGALLLARPREESVWRRLALVPAVSALAAVPMTAGFAGRGLLYTSWLENDRWLLIVVAVLTQIPLLAAGLTLVRPRSWPPGRPVIADLALMLPIIGLISWQEIGAVAPLAWGAIALQIVGALALFRFASEAGELQHILQEALAVRLEKRPDLAPLRRAGRYAGNALREATAILEGEGGLLWIVLFLVIVWLAR